MKRPKLKKASKRMTCHKRYKIQKKVREHHRKLRKEAKKRGHKKSRKDPGIPNSAPFKEALLREAELRKQQLEELKQQQKLDRQKEQDKKRKLETNPADEPSNIESKEDYQEVQDLIPKENLENWLNYLTKELPTVVFKASTNPKDKGRITKVKAKKKAFPLKNNVCFGKEGLRKFLGGFQQTCGKPIQVGVIGFPNVGKSSIINSLKQERICNVGISMGLTRSMQAVPLDKQITIIDSPSFIVSPLNSSAALALRSPASIEVVKPLEAASAILSQADARQVVLKYNVPGYENALEFFTNLAQRRGLHQKGGSPDTERAAKLLWSEWTGASLSYYCQPPTSWTLSPHFNESIVADMKKGFNLEELEQNNTHNIQAIQSPCSANSVLFYSSGLTNGIMEEKDIPELPGQKRERKQEERKDVKDTEKISDMSPVEETGEEALPEEPIIAGDPSIRPCIILDEKTKEDDAYDFSRDYV